MLVQHRHVSARELSLPAYERSLFIIIYASDRRGHRLVEYIIGAVEHLGSAPEIPAERNDPSVPAPAPVIREAVHEQLRLRHPETVDALLYIADHEGQGLGVIRARDDIYHLLLYKVAVLVFVNKYVRKPVVQLLCRM